MMILFLFLFVFYSSTPNHSCTQHFNADIGGNGDNSRVPLFAGSSPHPSSFSLLSRSPLPPRLSHLLPFLIHSPSLFLISSPHSIGRTHHHCVLLVGFRHTFPAPDVVWRRLWPLLSPLLPSNRLQIPHPHLSHPPHRPYRCRMQRISA